MSTGKYILKGKTPFVCDDLIDWARWFQEADRRVACDKVGECEVSTVFLGIDRRFGLGEPLLFETMVFGGEHNGDTERYSTWEEAEAGHKAMVERVKS